MKQIFLALSLISATGSFAQLEPFRHKDSSKILAIGKQLPDIPFGKVMDNQGNLSSTIQHKTSFKKLGKKLIILDFFHMRCSSCLEGFKEMTKLQEEFKDDIQIIAVNHVDKEAAYREFLQQFWKKGVEMVPANLPVIIESKEIDQLFPVQSSTGYHVWLDGDRKLLARGGSYITYAEKIRQYLKGEKISFLTETEHLYDQTKPYFASYFKNSPPLPKYYSRFGDFCEYCTATGEFAFNQVDSANNTKRNTFLNTSISWLYEEAYKDLMNADNKVLSGKNLVYKLRHPKPIYRFTSIRQSTDADLRNYSLCYEQIVPATMSEEERRSLMRKDLDSFFRQNGGFTAGMKEEPVDCYKLIRTSDMAISKDQKKAAQKRTVIKNKESYYVYENMPVHEIFRQFFFPLIYSDEIAAFSHVKKPLIIDGTETNELVTVELPHLYNQTMDQLRKTLQEFGFDLLPSKEKIKTLVFEDRRSVFGMQ